MKRILALALAAGIGTARATEVTVYNDNLGLVREKRTFTFKRGVNDVRVTDVAALIDPTSLHFTSLSDPSSLSILEQNFQYDLVDTGKLMQKYLGQEIDWERTLDGKREVLRGTLLSFQGGPVLQVGKKLYVNPDGRAILPELPEGFVTRPTLLWNINSKKDGSQETEIGYLTGGLSWSADYVVKTSPKDDRMDMNAWVTMVNNSGAAYKDAKLKLVAGDVNRVMPQEQRLGGIRYKAALAIESDASQFQEKSFFEYHLYALQRPATLMNNETKQIEFARAADVPVKKVFVYDPVANQFQPYYNEYTQLDPNYGLSSEKKVAVMLEFKNAKDNNLGIPLPKGKIRVYKQDTDGSLEFVGEDMIDHTPKDEEVRIKMGNAFDVVGERTRVNYEISTNRKTMTETFEIKLRNHKDEAVTVRVREHLYRWTNWRVTANSQKFTKKNAQAIEFDVPVPKDSQAVATYTVRYSW